LKVTVAPGYTVSVAEYPDKVFKEGDSLDIPMGRAMEQPWAYNETQDEMSDDQKEFRESLTPKTKSSKKETEE
jgi:hypothetical protein